MAKRRYKSVAVKNFRVERLVLDHSKPLVAGIDIAKEKQYVALLQGRTVLEIIHWNHPSETRDFMQMLDRLGAMVPSIEVVLEPSGVYGDPIAHAVSKAGHTVFMVSPKSTHDASEMFDGVPSIHDAKAASLIARLHVTGFSSPWRFKSESDRDIAAQLKIVAAHQERLRQANSRLEALTSRHWPELAHVLSPQTYTFKELLLEYGTPDAVSAAANEAKALMLRVSRGSLASSKVEAVLEASESSLGVPATPRERAHIQSVARTARDEQRSVTRELRELEELMESTEDVQELRSAFGVQTTAALLATAGHPKKYESAKALVKALGLNLRERSSGRWKPGTMRLTKRGHGVTRALLWLAACRAIHRDAVVQAWYTKKVARDGGGKQRAIVAVMRKLALAAWHVGRGHRFDSTRLFDTSRLELGAVG